MTKFGLLLKISGLSTVEAATFVNSSPDDVGGWSRGDHTAPDHVIEKIRHLIANQAQAADEALDIIEQHRPDQVELGYPLNDDEARSIGWPCLAAWKAMAARFVAECPSPITLLPRGSTPATAAAAFDRQLGEEA
ncbi:hypothetical protein ACK6D9_00715 [Hoeflea sp. Naph1]|uniref:hypothetical protein n=1 Tax=Hoeflea sp. Naph1 TaxID=3388653 RepID=UPI00398FC2FB